MLVSQLPRCCLGSQLQAAAAAIHAACCRICLRFALLRSPSFPSVPASASAPQLERSPLLHLGFQALDSFQASSGRLPEPGSEEDAAAVIAAAKAINDAASDKVRSPCLHFGGPPAQPSHQLSSRGLLGASGGPPTQRRRLRGGTGLFCWPALCWSGHAWRSAALPALADALVGAAFERWLATHNPSPTFFHHPHPLAEGRSSWMRACCASWR